MAFFFNRYPYTDFHELNLDWIISKIKEVKDSVIAAAASEEAAAGSAESATESAEAAAGSAESAAESAADAKNYADNIADPVSGLVTTWLEDNITEDPTVVIDASLSIAGAAADAKATGDAIADLPEVMGYRFASFEQGSWKRNGTNDPSYYTTRCRTPFYSVSKGQTVEIIAGANCQYFICAIANGENILYTTFRHDSYIWTAPQNCTFALNIAKLDSTQTITVSDVDLTVQLNTVPMGLFVDAQKSIIKLEEIANGPTEIFLTEWQNGGCNSSTGEVTGTKYRAVTTNILHNPDRDLHIEINDGFRIYIYFFNSEGTFTRRIGWISNERIIPFPIDKDSYFRIEVARTTDDTTETINASLFAQQVRIITDIQERITTPNRANASMISIAHQGYSITERTRGDSRLSSVYGAWKHGFEMVETDIKWSSDNVPVCCHDDTFVDSDDGTTVITISAHTAAELKTYGYYGETIATFEELLTLSKCYGMKVVIDKCRPVSEWGQTKWDILVGIVKKHKMLDRVWWGFANEADRINTILSYDPNATVIIDVGTPSTALALAREYLTDHNAFVLAFRNTLFSAADIELVNEGISETNIITAVYTIESSSIYHGYMGCADAIYSETLSARDVMKKYPY